MVGHSKRFQDIRYWVVAAYAVCVTVLACFCDIPFAVTIYGNAPSEIIVIKALFIIFTTSLLFIIVSYGRSRGEPQGLEDGDLRFFTPSRFKILSAASAVTVVLIGALAYKLAEVTIKSSENERLGVIAEFKSDQIEKWISERRDDVRVFSDGTAFADDLFRLGDTARARIEARLEWTRKAQGYSGIEILDTDIRLIAAAGETCWRGGAFQAVARQALNSAEPVLLDLYRQSPEKPPRLAYMAAIRDLRLPGHPALGLVVFGIDPESSLFPMLGQWPSASISGVTLIVRREKNEALFLSHLPPHLPHLPEVPLTLKISLANTDVPAVQALTRGNGIYEGRDYRGVPVLSASHAISGTPWMLIAKIDQDEVFSGVQTAAKICGGLILLGIAVIGVLTAMAWRQQRLRDRVRVGEHLELIVAAMPGALFSYRLDRDGVATIPYVSAAAGELLGIDVRDHQIDRSAFLGLMLEGEKSVFEHSIGNSARVMEAWRLEWRLRHPVKGVRWIEGSAIPNPMPDGSVVWHGHLNDISERKLAEIALSKVNRMLRARSLCNLALIRATDEAGFLKEVCSAIVDVCGHTMMWIGAVEHDEARSVRPIASAGIEEGYLENVRITWADVERGQGPTGTAIRTRQPRVCRDMATDPQLLPWRDEAARRGYASSIALPLISGDEVLWVLTIYSSETAVFPEDEIELLADVADDLAYGMVNLRLKAAHARAEKSLQESEAKLRLFIEHAPAALAMFNSDMDYQFASQRWLADYGLKSQDIIGRCHYELLPEMSERWKEIHKRCLGGAIEKCDEDTISWPDGRTDWLRWEFRPWYSEAGVGGIIAISERITDEVVSRQALRKLSLAVEQSMNSIIITDAKGNIEYVNDAFTRVSGYSRDEAIGRNPSFLASGKTSPEDIEQLWAALNSGTAWRGEFCNRRKSGEEYIESVWISPVRQQDGAISSYLAIQEDITLKKKNEEELAGYRAHLEELVANRTEQLQETLRLAEERSTEISDLYNNAPCGYHSLDANGTFVRINDTELSWLGYRRDEIVGKVRFPDLLDEEGKAIFWDNHSKFLERGYLHEVEYILRCRDGRELPVLISKSMVRDESGAGVRSRSVVYDLTERKAAETEALRQTKLAEAFFHNSLACLVILDKDYNYLRVNPAYVSASRRDANEFNGANYFEIYPSVTQKVFDKVVQTKVPCTAMAKPFVFPDQPDRGTTYWDWTGSHP